MSGWAKGVKAARKQPLSPEAGVRMVDLLEHACSHQIQDGCQVGWRA